MQYKQSQYTELFQLDRGEIDLNRMSKDGEFYVRVAVRSLKRAEAYTSELSTLAVLLRQESYKINFFLTSDLHKKIIEISANYLDEVVINYLNLDLINFRKKNGIADEATSITNVDAQIGLKNYYREVGQLDIHLKKVFPLFEQQLQTISINYFKHIVLMLARVETYENVLKHFYFNPHYGPTSLVGIRSTGSDWHKQGQNVLILEFKNTINEYFRVIYKPSPVLADVFLVGDLKKLATTFPAFKGKKSILEIFNENLPEHNKLLPTLIVPLCDDRRTDLPDIQRHFGFLEFVGNSRWYSIDRDTIEKKLFKLAPAKRADSRIPQNVVNKNFTKFVWQELQQADCRFIANNEQEGVVYSYQCGLLVLIMLAFGLGDSHSQNLIVDRVFGKYQFCTPRLIDNETCFTLQEPTIQALACFDANLGSMHPSSTNSEELHFLFDVLGKCTVTVDTYEKNKLLVCPKEYTKITPYTIDAKAFKEGLKKGMHILQAQQEKIMQWFEDINVQLMYVRVIPYTTYMFKYDIDHAFKNQYNVEEFINSEKKRLEHIERNCLVEMIRRYQENCKKTSEKYAAFFCVCQPPSPAIHNYREYLHHEYFAFSIPVYYARAASTVVWDSDGSEVQLTEAYQKLYPDQKNNDYFTISPLQFIKNRVNLLINDPEIKDEFLRRLETEVESIPARQKKLKNLLSDIEIPNKIKQTITSHQEQEKSSGYEF